MILFTLCVVHALIFRRKLSRRRLPIFFVYFVSHANAQALRPNTLTQRFRTTRYIFFFQLLWKLKILNVEDKQTKFEWSKGDLGQFSELCKYLGHERVWSNWWPHWCKKYTLMCFFSPITACILRFLSYKMVNFH